MKKYLFAILLLIGTTIAVTWAEEPFMPSFEETSSEAVLFRYRHFQDQEVGFRLIMETRVSFQLEGDEWNELMALDMGMSGFYTVTDVLSEEVVMIDYCITGMTVDLTGMFEAHFDSADPRSASKELANFQYFIDTPVICEIDSRGAVLATDAGPILQAMEAAGQNILADELEQQFAEYTKSSFVWLAEGPVRIGDVYDAGELVNNVSGLGDFTVAVSYEVAAISADKKLAVLVPLVRFAMDEIDMSESRMEGWILFDLEKGNVLSSFGKLQLRFEMTEGGVTYPVMADSIVRYTVEF